MRYIRAGKTPCFGKSAIKNLKIKKNACQTAQNTYQYDALKIAQVVELVDTYVWGAYDESRVGSSPVLSTNLCLTQTSVGHFFCVIPRVSAKHLQNSISKIIRTYQPIRCLPLCRYQTDSAIVQIWVNTKVRGQQQSQWKLMKDAALDKDPQSVVFKVFIAVSHTLY